MASVFSAEATGLICEFEQSGTDFTSHGMFPSMEGGQGSGRAFRNTLKGSGYDNKYILF
jgi:hypothetical protein